MMIQFCTTADELESQQGIAHLTEHVAYMGSSKRERLFGTGSQTNGKFLQICSSSEYYIVLSVLSLTRLFFVICTTGDNSTQQYIAIGRTI